MYWVVDACVQAEGQPVAGCVDIADDAVKLTHLKSRQVQDRPEYFTLQIRNTVDALKRGGTKVPSAGVFSSAIYLPSWRAFARRSEMILRAASSMTVPTSVDKCQAAPMCKTCIAAISILVNLGVTFSCTYRHLRAEQR